MKLFLTAFGSLNQAVGADLPDHAHFPVASTCAEGLDLDYTSLLLGGSYIIDKSVYAHVCDCEHKHLRSMAKTLSILKDESFLDIVDGAQVVDKRRNEINKKIDNLIEEPLIWVSLLRSHWEEVLPSFEAFSRDFPDIGRRKINTSHFGIYNYIMTNEGRFSETEYKRLERLIMRKGRRHTSDELDALKGILRPLVEHVVVSDLMRETFASPILDWDDAQGYYDKLYTASWSNPTIEFTLRQQVRMLFEVVIPSLKPDNIREVIKFISDKNAVTSLRDQISQNISSGEEVSTVWFTKFSQSVMSRHLQVQDRVKRFRWLGAFVGSLLPGSSIFNEIGVELASNKAEDVFDAAQNKSFKWYYSLQREALSRPK